MAPMVDAQYPNISWLVQNGRIEIGYEYYATSFIRVMDEGGMIWESEKEYETIADALADADAAIAAWAKANGLFP
ncbi:MAG: hypothetical protein H0T73_10100 [Ardenticatenales bacterium]|nr:hypothetical protein [Ardenticatenales bacterium]